MPRRTTIQKAEHAQKIENRQRNGLRMWLAGVTYREIGAQLKISHEQARRDVKAVFDELTQESRGDLLSMRDLSNARLDMARRAIAGQVMNGDLNAVKTWVKIEERSAKLNGLDAPILIHQKIEAVSEAEEMFDFSRLTEADLNLYIQLQEKMLVPPVRETGAAS